jgi:hypothetical protein
MLLGSDYNFYCVMFAAALVHKKCSRRQSESTPLKLKSLQELHGQLEHDCKILQFISVHLY